MTFTRTLPAQVVEVIPVFPKINDDVTIIFNATQGNGALTGVSPVYAHAGLITSESTNPSDWKHVQGVWGTPDANVLMQSLGNNRHSISYNIKDFHNLPDGEEVESLAFVFRNANGTIVGRATDGSDIFYPVYPDDVEFLSVLLSPQHTSLALFENEEILIKGATSQDALLSIYDNDELLVSQQGNLLEYNLVVEEPGDHEVRFVAIRDQDTLTQTFFYTVILNVNVQDPPAGREYGLTMTSESSVYLQLYAPEKSFVHVIGDLANWNPRAPYQMNRSVDGTTWWLDINGLNPGTRYQYQYLIDGTLKIGDPYSTLVLDPFNDPGIPADRYPNLPPYPYGQTTGIVTSFVLESEQITETLSPKPAKSDLVIYELLLRDFLQKATYQTLLDTLDYLDRLGISAIELMPVQEFEGNLGWGYNPSYHMALDKMYGPEETFRALIDECHARGIAVILDVVYNHAFGQSPFAQLYWDASQNRPAANNPWLNPVAKHDFNVGNDFNHDSPQTQYFVKRVIRYWMETYGIDGFRFDLSKGFTQNNTLGNTNAWGLYDQPRIDRLTDYAQFVWSIDPEAYVILEHFAANDEEIELSNRGMMLWGNMTGAFGQASMGYGGSDLGGLWHVQRGWSQPHLVGYMESHDEERIMYKNLNFGNSAPGYNIKELPIALSRMELVSVYHALVPGPKMIWEFGELGFDFSINRCPDGTVNNNCRLEPKPIRWDYYNIDPRRRIYDVVRAMNHLRQQTAWKEGALTISLANQFEKKMQFRHDDMDIVVAGNFHIGERTITTGFTKTGKWYDYIQGDSLTVDDVNNTYLYEPGEYHIYTSKRVPLDFDISTSLKEAFENALPLTIRPTINDGVFFLDFEEEGAADPDFLVFGMDGQAIPLSVQSQRGGYRITLPNALPGIYFVAMRHEEHVYVGKISVMK